MSDVIPPLIFAKRIERLSGSLIREILQIAQRPEVISFAGGLPAEVALPPLDLSKVPNSVRQYGASEGEPALRALVAAQLRALGMVCDAEQVLITAGSQQGIDLVAKLFVDDGTPVLVESPTFLAAVQCLKLFGAALRPLVLHTHGIDPDELRHALREQRPAFVYLIPTFQNPSGYCYSAATRAAVAAVLDEFNVPLVEDDPYRELVYDDADRQPLCALLERAPWVYLGSFSKTLSPGLRLGYLACSPALFPFFVKLKQAADLHTNRLSQWWVTEFISGPHYADHLHKVRDHYRTQRNAMDHALREHLHDLADWNLPSGGLFFWLRLKQTCDTRQLLPKALARNLAFMPGEPFFPVPVAHASTLRLNFSHATPARIAAGVALLAELVRAHALS